MARFNKMKVKKLYLGSDQVKSGGQNTRSTLVTATAANLNQLATGAVTADLTGDVTGDVTGDINSLGTALTEHGLGAIGTAFAPRTYHFNRDGHIITEIHVDITGLACKGDLAKDAIGLSTGGAAYIGRYTTALYGIVYRAEIMCVELPGEGTATITADIDVGIEGTGTVAYDGAVATVLINTASMVAGEQVEKVNPGVLMSANDYIYLVEGDAAANTGVYNAGQYILRFYGHALIT
jgi:hypothetical protein